MKKPLKKKWKPKFPEPYYYINFDGLILRQEFFRFGCWPDKVPACLLNCFKTKAEATAARARVRKALKGMK